jgi:hypothetical protein
LTAGRIGRTVCVTMRSWVALTRWAHLTLALGLLPAVAPPAIGQQPITLIHDAVGRLVAVVDPITAEAALPPTIIGVGIFARALM